MRRCSEDKYLFGRVQSGEVMNKIEKHRSTTPDVIVGCNIIHLWPEAVEFALKKGSRFCLFYTNDGSCIFEKGIYKNEPKLRKWGKP